MMIRSQDYVPFIASYHGETGMMRDSSGMTAAAGIPRNGRDARYK
jgi:hypothetical protein